MSHVRKQSIVSTVFVYAGFVIGFVNTYLFTREGSFFTPSEYGLTIIFIAVGNMMYAFANLGMVSVIYKFYPYYDDNLPKKNNDLLTWVLVVSMIGFVFVILAGIVFKDLVIRKFGSNSPELVQYYFWIFPFGFSLLLFSILEVFAWNMGKSIFTTFLREFFFRAVILALIFLTSFHIIDDFDSFIKLYAFSYGVVALVLLVYLIYKKEFYITFTISRVTKRFYKKIATMASLVYVGSTIFTIAMFIDNIIIASLLGTDSVAIFGFAFVISGLVQAPQRGAVAASIPVLSRAWKSKDYEKINLIYQRSGINLLIVSLGIFLVIWLNYVDAVQTFKLKPAYIESVWIFFFLGIARVIDLGTGVNSQIIGTSVFWRFEFISGMILLSLAVPLNYYLVKHYGVIGAGYSAVISYSVYNTIRILFLKRKFNMHPFSRKTIYVVLWAFFIYGLCYFSFINMHGIIAMILRSVVFIALYVAAIVYFDLTPDILSVWVNMKSRVLKQKDK